MRAAKARLEQSGQFRGPIMTDITPASAFYRAEEYTSCYLEKRRLAHRSSPGTDLSSRPPPGPSAFAM